VLPPITIVITTYAPPGEDGVARREAAVKTWASWVDHLKYDGEILVHVADDGSSLEGYDHSYWTTLNQRLQLTKEHVTYSRQERCGVGASWNQGLRVAHEQSPLSLYAVDDWQLLADYDLTPWANLLMTMELGAMRLGPPHPWLTGQVEHVEGGWMLRLDRHHYTFSMRPTLFHRRLFDAYGPLDEDISVMECERLYNERFCAANGPDIALALPHPWDHIYSVELAYVEPQA
jgi:catechol 2,3-dioxygenase-like lactoylglutathione lyase family enzyme